MYRSNKLGLIEWIVLLVILAIPIVNIIVGVWLYIRKGTSSTVRNFILALAIIFVVTAVLGFTTDILNNVSDLIGGN